MDPLSGGPDPSDVRPVVRAAIEEDLRYGEDATTTATVPAGLLGEATLAARTSGTVAGIPVALDVFDALGSDRVEVVGRRADGERLIAGDSALVVRGQVRALLAAERTALNLLSHLSGVATATAQWVSAVAGTRCVIRDTRKTAPGLRALQKYAVRCGGGTNHRMALGDAVLIKDNHVIAAGSVAAAVRAVRASAAQLPCEVEVDDLEQLREALAEDVDEILLDNFTVDECAEAVRIREVAGVPTRLESSGGLRLDVARTYAETGVDFLAVGALTHSVTALDIGMDLRTEG